MLYKLCNLTDDFGETVYKVQYKFCRITVLIIFALWLLLYFKFPTNSHFKSNSFF